MEAPPAVVAMAEFSSLFATEEEDGNERFNEAVMKARPTTVDESRKCGESNERMTMDKC